MDCELMPSPVKISDPPAFKPQIRKSRAMAEAPSLAEYAYRARRTQCRAVPWGGPLVTWLMTGCAALWREKYWSI